MLRDIGEPGGSPSSWPLLPVLTAPGSSHRTLPQTAQRWHSLAYNLLESHTSTSGSGGRPTGLWGPRASWREVGPCALTPPRW